MQPNGIQTKRGKLLLRTSCMSYILAMPLKPGTVLRQPNRGSSGQTAQGTITPICTCELSPLENKKGGAIFICCSKMKLSTSV